MIDACTVPDCEKKRRSGLALYCEMHYYRLRRTGKLTARPQALRPAMLPKAATEPRLLAVCQVEGCDKPVRDIGMCSKHASRVRRHGDPNAFTHQRDRNLPRGEASHKWTGDDATYNAMHQRVKAAMGPASEHKCVDCGRGARHWSYDHDDLDERMSDVGAYSVSINHYLPRCVSCHKKHDVSVKPVRRAPVDLDEIRRLHAQGVRVQQMSRLLGVGRKRIDAALDDLGLPRFPARRPEARELAVAR